MSPWSFTIFRTCSGGISPFSNPAEPGVFFEKRCVCSRCHFFARSISIVFFRCASCAAVGGAFTDGGGIEGGRGAPKPGWELKPGGANPGGRGANPGGGPGGNPGGGGPGGGLLYIDPTRDEASKLRGGLG